MVETLTLALNSLPASRAFHRFTTSNKLFPSELGGTIGQNLSAGLGYDYMQFALLGMVANLLVQFTMMGVTSLIEERENGFTQEIFVSPVSRYSILIGKIIGGSLTGAVALMALFIVAFAMGIPLSLVGIERVLLVTPVLFLLGGSSGVLLSGIFGSSPKAVDRATIMVMFPQMFLSGALIPVKNSTGVSERPSSPDACHLSSGPTERCLLPGHFGIW